MDGRCGMRCWCATRGGFTLLEAVIAFAVLLGISALVLPSFVGRAERSSREQGIRRVGVAVTAAQGVSRREGVVVRVVCPRGTGVIEGEGLPADAGATPGRAEPLAILPAGCSLEGPSAAEEAGEGQGAARGVIVGWALPDGSFVTAPGVRLAHGGLEATLGFGSWTGRVSAGEWQVGPDEGEEQP